MLTFDKITASVREIADEYPLKKVSVFGSYADGTNKEKSDLDILVEFATPAISLLTLAGIKYRLEDRLNVDVDVIHAPIPKDSLLVLNKVVTVYEQ